MFLSSPSILGKFIAGRISQMQLQHASELWIKTAELSKVEYYWVKQQERSFVLLKLHTFKLYVRTLR